MIDKYTIYLISTLILSSIALVSLGAMALCVVLGVIYSIPATESLFLFIPLVLCYFAAQYTWKKAQSLADKNSSEVKKEC